jgi:hypothetical protein
MEQPIWPPLRSGPAKRRHDLRQEMPAVFLEEKSPVAASNLCYVGLVQTQVIRHKANSSSIKLNPRTEPLGLSP